MKVKKNNLYDTSEPTYVITQPRARWPFPVRKDVQKGDDYALTLQWTTDPKILWRHLPLPVDLPKKTAEVLTRILVEIVITGRADPDQFISYSRNCNFYRNKRRSRYGGSLFSYTRVLRAIDILSDLGLIIHARVPQNHLGIQSSLKASPKLLQALAGVHLPILFCSRETVILRDFDKCLSEYDDSTETRRMRKALQSINVALARTEISLYGRTILDGDTLVGLIDRRLLRELDIEDDLSLGLIAQNRLRRIFNNCNFDLGGRLYGWWQGLPERLRQEIHLNGEACIELDYHAIHPSILYSEVGAVLQDDPYDVPGAAQILQAVQNLGALDVRDVIKTAFNCMLNSSTSGKAIGALSEKFAELRAERIEKGGAICIHHWKERPPRKKVRGDKRKVRFEGDRNVAKALYEAIKVRHLPIAAFFGSGKGLELQRLDSELAERVLLTLLKEGIVALPVHDSFIVAARHRDRLEEVMRQASLDILDLELEVR